jgi:hypothetical protein
MFVLARRAPKLGESVVAFGFPLGLPLSVTRGVVSGSDRTIPIEGVKRQRLIQTDAALNPGNSGGPLIDPETGVVLGLVDLGSDFNGVSFAVSAQVAEPLLRAWTVAPQLQPAATCSPPPATQAPSVSPPVSDPSDEQARQDIEQVLYDHHEAIAQADYNTAWDLLSSRKQQQNLAKDGGYAAWVKAQSSLTPYLDPTDIHVEILDYDAADETATVMVTGMRWSAPGARCSEWSGITWVRFEDGSWRYDPGYSTTPEREATWKSRYPELLGASC